jgi:hypothetical protein
MNYLEMQCQCSMTQNHSCNANNIPCSHIFLHSVGKYDYLYYRKMIAITVTNLNDVRMVKTDIFHLQGILRDILGDDRCNILVASVRGTGKGKAVPTTGRGGP